MSTSQTPEPLGCLLGLVNAVVRGILRLFGLGAKGARAGLAHIDVQYKAFVDSWVAERLAAWLNQTRSEIDPNHALRVLNGEADYLPEVVAQIRQTLIDCKVTFVQREGKQFLEVEAYMAPRQLNGKQPQVLRWRAEREIAWGEIPNDVRERLIRLREPVTLSYNIPQVSD